MQTISRVLSYCQRELFPGLEEDFGPLSEPLRAVVRAIEMVPIEDFVRRRVPGTRGRPLQDRAAIARALIAMQRLKLMDIRALIAYLHSSPMLRKICGWNRRGEIPSEATFSRAFAEFAESNLPARLHEKVVADVFENRIVGHISRDSTDIPARERPALKPPREKKTGRRRPGRPRKGEEPPRREPTRLERQTTMTLQAMLDDLPKVCDRGSKTRGKGQKSAWCGYRLHVDFADSEIPISCILTSASVHDSQAALPLSLMTAQRVTSLYDLMDAAYDVPLIHDHCRALGHVPIIDHNRRRAAEKRQMDPATAERYKIRTTAERGYSQLKDGSSARSVRYRGHAKVFTYLMFGILMLTVDRIASLLA